MMGAARRRRAIETFLERAWENLFAKKVFPQNSTAQKSPDRDQLIPGRGVG